MDDNQAHWFVQKMATDVDLRYDCETLQMLLRWKSFWKKQKMCVEACKAPSNSLCTLTEEKVIFQHIWVFRYFQQKILSKDEKKKCCHFLILANISLWFSKFYCRTVYVFRLFELFDRIPFGFFLSSSPSNITINRAGYTLYSIPQTEIHFGIRTKRQYLTAKAMWNYTSTQTVTRAHSLTYTHIHTPTHLDKHSFQSAGRHMQARWQHSIKAKNLHRHTFVWEPFDIAMARVFVALSIQEANMCKWVHWRFMCVCCWAVCRRRDAVSHFDGVLAHSICLLLTQTENSSESVDRRCSCRLLYLFQYCFVCYCVKWYLSNNNSKMYSGRFSVFIRPTKRPILIGIFCSYPNQSFWLVIL